MQATANSRACIRDATRGTTVFMKHQTKKGQRGIGMLWTIAVILIILWLLGLVTSTSMGGFIHVLLVIAVIVVLLNIIRGRKH
jgi:hypothetical protein